MPPWNLRTRRVGGVCAEPGFYLCFLASQPCKTAAALWVKCMIPGIEMPLPEAELSHQPVRCCEGRAGQNVGCDVKAPVGPVAATTVSWVCAAPGGCSRAGPGFCSDCGPSVRGGRPCVPGVPSVETAFFSSPCTASQLVHVHPCCIVSWGRAWAWRWPDPGVSHVWSGGGGQWALAGIGQAARDSGWHLAVCGQSSFVPSDAEPQASSMRTGCW